MGIEPGTRSRRRLPGRSRARRTFPGTILSALLALTATVPGQADLPRHDPVPGGIAVIALKAPLEERPLVRFGEHRVYVARNPDGWSAVVGLPCDILPGNYIVTVSGTQRKNTSVELGVVPHPPHLPEQEEGGDSGRDRDRNPVITLPRRTEVQSVVNEAMSREIEFDPALAEGLVPDFRFQAPVESTRSVDYGRLILDGRLWCHDYLSFFLPAANPVYAPAPGKVAGIDAAGEHGQRIVIAHADGVASVLGNLGDVRVEVGQPVERGEVLGSVGRVAGVRTGRLDWAVALNGHLVDPLRFSPSP